MKKNAIIEALKIEPQTAESLPYKPSPQKFGVKNRLLLQKIHVNSHRYRKNQTPHKQFVTVYYILGDVERAVELFVKINYEALSNLNFKGNNLLWSGMPKDIAKRIVAEFKSQPQTFKVLNQNL